MGSPKHLSHGRSDAWDTAGVLLDEKAAENPIDLAALFGNAGLVEMEIGSGKGTFIVTRAAARPEVNFLGLEWARPYCHYAADRVKRAQLTNVRMLRTDASPFVKNCIADGSLWRMHVYFPDPWPKARHHRRRLIQPAFIEQVWRVLRPGGQLIIVTDHQDYFGHIRGVLAHAKGFAIVPMPRMSDQEGELVGTNFERKYIAQGRPFYSAVRMKYV